jgi:hypothetical protein
MLLPLFKTATLFAQVNDAASFEHLSKIIRTERISDDDYNVVNYQKKGSELSNVTILNRKVEHSDFEGKKCIKITELDPISNAVNKTTIIIEEKNLAPLYYETSVNDTLIRKAVFQGNFMLLTDSMKTKSIQKKIELPATTFLSNSFSELVESADINKYPKYTFETITPGLPAHRFFVEKVNEAAIPLTTRVIDCYLLKFTVTDLDNKLVATVYRYVDKKYGKVIALKTNIDKADFFGYERLFFSEK